jgi:hypothetical protein
VYQENVEPLIKLLHVPSVELILRDARRNHGKLTPANEALVFTIYFAAITSLESDDVRIPLLLVPKITVSTADLACLRCKSILE